MDLSIHAPTICQSHPARTAMDAKVGLMERTLGAVASGPRSPAERPREVGSSSRDASRRWISSSRGEIFPEAACRPGSVPILDRQRNIESARVLPRVSGSWGWMTIRMEPGHRSPAHGHPRRTDMEKAKTCLLRRTMTAGSHCSAERATPPCAFRAVAFQSFGRTPAAGSRRT